jgi:hypothetical protein
MVLRSHLCILMKLPIESGELTWYSSKLRVVLISRLMANFPFAVDILQDCVETCVVPAQRCEDNAPTVTCLDQEHDVSSLSYGDSASVAYLCRTSLWVPMIYNIPSIFLGWPYLKGAQGMFRPIAHLADEYSEWSENH